MRPVRYAVTWQWRDEWEAGVSSVRVEEVMATHAAAALAKTRRILTEEYADVGRNFIPLEVDRV